MADVLVVALSPPDHFNQLLSVAGHLAVRGDHVTVLTSERHAAVIRSVGARPYPLPPRADLDAHCLNALPGRTCTSVIRRLNAALTRLFIEPIPEQTAILAYLIRKNNYSAIVVDSAFLGIIPLLLNDHSTRPPVLAFSSTPLMVTSRDTAPRGMGLAPSSSRLGRGRNRTLNALLHKVILGPAHRTANRVLKSMNTRQLPVFVLDSGVLADRYIVPTVPQFEYPRSDLPANVRYVGAVQPLPLSDVTLPSWFDQFCAEKNPDIPVVYLDLSHHCGNAHSSLGATTLAALHDANVIIVITTGGHSHAGLDAPLPSNSYVSDYLPYDLLLSHIDVMITDGRYTSVQQALSAGIPLVVAGDRADQPDVAARVQWSGAGVNLGSARPSPQMLRRAVFDVLEQPRYRERARQLETEFAQRHGSAEIAALIDEVIAERESLLVTTEL